MSEESAKAASTAEKASSEPAPQQRRRKGKRSVPRGIAHVRSTFNNTTIAVSDQNGDIIAWKSGGAMKFKGSRKGTPFAAQRAAQEVGEICRGKFGMREIDVRVQGPGPGRESAIRGLQSAGIDVKSIEDVSPLPHNGCRPRKKRRI